MRTELELVVDGGSDAAAARFFRAGTEVLGLLDELSETPVDWVVSDLRLGSAVVRVEAPQAAAEESRALRSAVKGLRAISARESPPGDWNPGTLEAARRLAVLDGGSEGGVGGAAKLSLVEDGRPTTSVDLDADLAEALDSLHPAERRMPGAVRGTLVGVNVSQGNRASIRTGKNSVVRVKFAPHLRRTLKDALYQPVEVTGTARQDASGRVFRIEADDARVLTQPTLRWSELFGYDPDITGGLTVDEYLESSRGEA